MKYLLLLNRVEDALPEAGTAEADEMMRAYGAAVGAMAEAGVLVDCAPLTAASAATTVRVRDGEMLLTDGPAAALREQVGGSDPGRQQRIGGGPAHRRHGEDGLSRDIEAQLRACWWGAVAAVARLT